MAMSYTSLVAPKGAAGSLMNWVSYSKLDAVTVLDEAQPLLYSLLRVREMRSQWTFGVSEGQSQVPLISRFLDPIGRMRDLTNNIPMRQWTDSDVTSLRAFDTSYSGSFGPNPFATTNGSSLVSVQVLDHDLSQGSTLRIAGATTVGGLTLNGTFPVVSITDEDNLVIDVGSDATSSATGGGGIATWSSSKLIKSTPTIWTVFDEKLQFDCAAERAFDYQMLCFKAPVLLSTAKPSNWLTNRYPHLLREACIAASHRYMKDTEEYNKSVSALTALVGSVNAENDLFMRGMEFGTDTPTPGDYY